MSPKSSVPQAARSNSWVLIADKPHPHRAIVDAFARFKRPPARFVSANQACLGEPLFQTGDPSPVARLRWAADSAVPKPISNNTLGASWTPLGHKPREEGASTTPNSAMRFSWYYSQNTRFNSR